MNLNDEKTLVLKSLLKPVLISLVVGSLVSSYLTYRYMKVNYVEIHSSEVGGFIFKDNKVYNLAEVNGLDIKLSVAKPGAK